MYGIIYCAYCTTTGKSYVGQTIQGLKRRWIDHTSGAKRKTLPISQAIAEQGATSFELSVLAEAETPEQLNELEKLWIILKQSHDPAFGYNSTFGGHNPKLTDQYRAKLSLAKQGKQPSEATIAAVKLSNTGRAPWNKGKRLTSPVLTA